MKHVTSSIIVALDVATLDSALSLADHLDPTLCRLKVGKELFTAVGPQVVRSLIARGFEIFLDLKFHDIPNTTAQAVISAAELGVWMTNVHATVGLDTLYLCRKCLDDGRFDTLLIAVTVLTSMKQDNLRELGISASLDEQVMRLATLAHQACLDGVVCSAQEAPTLKQAFGTDFKLVTPGIRTPDDAKDDQARICTPQDARARGSDYLVIGRSITSAADPNAKLQAILASLGN